MFTGSFGSVAPRRAARTAVTAAMAALTAVTAACTGGTVLRGRHGHPGRRGCGPDARCGAPRRRASCRQRPRARSRWCSPGTTRSARSVSARRWRAAGPRATGPVGSSARSPPRWPTSRRSRCCARAGWTPVAGGGRGRRPPAAPAARLPVQVPARAARRPGRDPDRGGRRHAGASGGRGAGRDHGRQLRAAGTAVAVRRPHHRQPGEHAVPGRASDPGRRLVRRRPGPWRARSDAGFDVLGLANNHAGDFGDARPAAHGGASSPARA